MAALPLKIKTAEAVAYDVIFLIFRAAAILQYDKGRECSNQIISEICFMWKDVKVNLMENLIIVKHKAQLKDSVRVYIIC